jgi:hypothetical protein
MDEPSPEQITVELLRRFFAAVSFPAGGSPRYQQLQELFSAEGRLIRNSGEVPQDLGVEQFVLDRQRAVDTGDLTSFDEAELTGRTDVFGRIAHRYSSYTKRGVLGGTAFEGRGMISTQFIQEPDGWRISSMAWDDERPGLTLPS